MFEHFSTAGGAGKVEVIWMENPWMNGGSRVCIESLSNPTVIAANPPQKRGVKEPRKKTQEKGSGGTNLRNNNYQNKGRNMEAERNQPRLTSSSMDKLIAPKKRLDDLEKTQRSKMERKCRKVKVTFIDH